MRGCAGGGTGGGAGMNSTRSSRSAAAPSSSASFSGLGIPRGANAPGAAGVAASGRSHNWSTRWLRSAVTTSMRWLISAAAERPSASAASCSARTELR